PPRCTIPTTSAPSSSARCCAFSSAASIRCWPRRAVPSRSIAGLGLFQRRRLPRLPPQRRGAARAGPRADPSPTPPCPPRAPTATGQAREPVTEPLPAGGLLEIRPLVVTPVDIARPDARQIDLDPIPVEPWSAPASAKTSSTGAEAAPASDPLAALKA